MDRDLSLHLVSPLDGVDNLQLMLYYANVEQLRTMEPLLGCQREHTE